MITLANDTLRLGIDPNLGAGIADFSTKGPTGFFFPLIRRAAPGETNASLLGSFFMAPWVNRIRGARFVFRGKEHQLRPTTADGLAQHGDVRKRVWRVLEQSGDRVSLEFDSRSVTDSNWPWAYVCRATYALTKDTMTIELSVTNTDTSAFPAGCGHHPYFARRLWNDSDVIELQAGVGGKYPLAGGCASGPAASDPLSSHFAAMRPLPPQALDAVFAGFDGAATLRWPSSGVSLRIEASKELSHLLVFAPHDKGALSFIAVEPQSQVNDAFNLAKSLGHEPGDPGDPTGTVVLEPGATLRTVCAFTVR
ncbi:MAG: aldose 1-epimerase [Phycisphaerales bacterium]|nr:aldose 1-epimerase [Phycisphaerales bacterium]